MPHTLFSIISKNDSHQYIKPNKEGEYAILKFVGRDACVVTLMFNFSILRL